MAMAERSAGAWSSLLLARSRELLRSRVGLLMVSFVAIVYTFVSLLVGQMLVVARTEFPSVQVTVLYGAGSSAWWNYPALVVTAPGGTLVLPFLATITMAVVAVGVGIGMSVGLVLAYRLLRRGGRAQSGSAGVGSLTGLTPAMIALVTLGACCSTTAAATAGIGAIAQASGVSIASVLANNWYLDVFQVAVLWVALVAQEQLLVVYSRVLVPGEVAVPNALPRRIDTRYLVGGALRVLLVIGGVTWALASLAVWTSTPSPNLTPGLVAQTVLEHLAPAFFGVAAGLFPAVTYRAVRSLGRRASGGLLRGVLLLGGLSLLTWTPAPLAGAGVFALVNEALGAVGASATLGAVAPPAVGPAALALRWGLQFLLLGGFAVVAAVSPESAFLPLQWAATPERTPSSPSDRDVVVVPGAGASATASGPSPGDGTSGPGPAVG